MGSLPLCALVIYHIRESNYEVEDVKVVGDGEIDEDDKSETIEPAASTPPKEPKA